jgi:hypothetical protein
MEAGYGWSAGPPLDKGFGMVDQARIVDKLVTGLGYEKYAVQVRLPSLASTEAERAVEENRVVDETNQQG